MPRLRFTSTVQGVSTIELNEPIITIGRVANNVVCIEDPNISKHHTLLVSEDDTYKIYDLHSVNGTWVNGERITVTKLKEGDAVRIGYLELKYEIAAPVVAKPVLTAPIAGPRPTLVSPVASKTATGPTTLAARPRLGLKSPGASGTAVVVPVVGAVSHPPVAVVQPVATPPPVPTAPPPPPPAPMPAPTKEPPRTMIRLPEEKNPIAPAAPAPPPIPVASTPPPPLTPPPAPTLGGPPKLKTFTHESTPPPPPAAPEPVAEPVPAEPAAPIDAPPAAPTVGPKKLGAAPGGGPPKFKLKRE